MAFSMGLGLGLGFGGSRPEGDGMGGFQLYNARKLLNVDPATLGGVYHHADDLAVGTVTSWANRVSGGNAATSAGVPCTADFGVNNQKCVTFNGTTHSFSQNDIAAQINNGHGFTAWVAHQGVGTNLQCAIGATGSGAVQWQLFVTHNSYSAMLFVRNDASVTSSSYGSPALAANTYQWTGWRLNRHGNASVSFPFNGRIQPGTVQRPAIPTTGTVVAGPAFIGSANGSASYFQGKIRAIGIHPGMLTMDQIIGIQNNIGFMPKKVVCIGNSLTAGVGGTPYPTQLKALLPPNYDVFNLGIQGCETIDLEQQPNNGVEYQFGEFGANFLVIWEVTNDFYFQEPISNPLASAQLAYSRICALVANMRKTRPWSRIITATCLKRGGQTANFEAARLLVNAMLLSGAGGAAGDVVRDWGSFAQFQDTTNVTYFTDGVHLTTLGYSLIASDLSTALQAL